jgi:hypothetical protein
MNAVNADKLLYWIETRWDILKQKEAGAAAPWTEDKTFQEVYFCNVFREDDKVTKGIRELWAIGNGDVADAAANMIMARFVNKLSTLESLQWPWPEFDRPLWDYTMSKAGAWGGAYIVSTNGRSMPKHEYIGDLLEHLFEHFKHNPLPNTLATAHTALMGLQGLGSFMAAQVIADLKNTPLHNLSYAPDWWSWCAHGPGSLRGMSWVWGVDRVTPKQFLEYMRPLRVLVDGNLPDHIPPFCNQDLQNCLCEFDKYMRVSTGVGRSKRKYAGA